MVGSYQPIFFVGTLCQIEVELSRSKFVRSPPLIPRMYFGHFDSYNELHDPKQWRLICDRKLFLAMQMLKIDRQIGYIFLDEPSSNFQASHRIQSVPSHTPTF